MLGSIYTMLRKKARMDKGVTDALREKLTSAGQAHLLKFLDEGKLSASEEAQLATQLATFDFEKVQVLLKTSLDAEAELKNGEQDIKPLSADSSVTIEEATETKDQLSAAGFELIRDGKVAFVVLSGGQGTRLGFNGPKGCYNIELPSGKTLFQMQAERLLKLQTLVAAKFPDHKEPVKIPYYVMTSPLNHAATEKYFVDNNFFGLAKTDVSFFMQGTLPCLTSDGKLILETKAKVATAPDGNGGIYAALEKSGQLKDMQKRKIKWIMACSVDNALIQVADPLFLGVCDGRGVDVGNKSTVKADWNEQVGVMGMKNGKFNVVEYSEISEDMAKSKDASDNLQFRAANVCIHCFTVDFIVKTLSGPPTAYHIARKKIPAADANGEAVKPTENNGLKLEMFIFDVFALTDNFVNLECERKDNFAPVKNAPGKPTDSPDSARRLIFERSKRWLEAAGATITVGDDLVCEVTPAASLAGEGLEMFKDQTLQTPLIVMMQSDTKDVPIEASKLEDGAAGVKLYKNPEGLNVYILD